MPWTFSHPAAVLPLRRFSPKYLSLPALVCGTLVPDVGYYLSRFDIASYAHTALGGVVAGVPIGLACLLLFYGLREPLWFLLPQPHRSALEPLVRAWPRWSPAFIGSAIVSVLIGVWTHNAWDSFTHPGGWVVRRVAVLRAPLLGSGYEDFRVYNVLQHLSTVAGAAALTLAYLAWLRRQPPIEPAPGDDRLRYIAVLGAAFASLAVALMRAHQLSIDYAGGLTFHTLLVYVAIQSVSVLATALLGYSVIYFVLKRIAPIARD
ncbi:MAG: DUF4184 family protein [Gammaproteobacteria bacterium]